LIVSTPREQHAHGALHLVHTITTIAIDSVQMSGARPEVAGVGELDCRQQARPEHAAGVDGVAHGDVQRFADRRSAGGRRRPSTVGVRRVISVCSSGGYLRCRRCSPCGEGQVRMAIDQTG
jgi:hypothetical protein